jgi:epoxyqueuosine reductase
LPLFLLSIVRWLDRSAAELENISSDLKREARRLGLGPTAVTSARPSARFSKYQEWLDKGYHGKLAYMERADRVARRKDPRIILPGAQAVIMTTLFYWPGMAGFPAEHNVQPDGSSVPLARGGKCGDARGIVSAYAWGTDYHVLLESRLQALGEWLVARAGGVGRFYVDTGAVLERDFAERAGLGFIGKNSLLINPDAGSGFFLGGLFTTVPLPLDGDGNVNVDAIDAGKRRGRPGCGGCTKCKVACPTGAIVKDRVVDARKCISYLTIELKDDIPEDLRPLMGARVYGCDICQIVCPWTKRVSIGGPAAEAAAKINSAHSPLFGTVPGSVSTPHLGRLLWETKASFKARFANTAAERIGRDRMARNAAVALGNVGGHADIAALGAASVAHPSQLVREHAAWALRQVLSRAKRPAGVLELH